MKNGVQNLQLTAHKTATILVYYKFTRTGAQLLTLKAAKKASRYLDELERV
ncbi:MAG: hypothetical protein ACI88A_004646 [Paraglaciecola sp.]|jgi:hypothetical protein